MSPIIRNFIEHLPVEIVHCFADVMKLNLGRNSEARFGPFFNFKFSRDANVWLRF